MPPALSAIGPKISIVRTYAAVDNIPIVATAVPNRPSALPSTRPEELPSQYDKIKAADITKTGNPVASKPIPIPAITLVACPVVEASAIMRTGLYL